MFVWFWLVLFHLAFFFCFKEIVVTVLYFSVITYPGI